MSQPFKAHVPTAPKACIHDYSFKVKYLPGSYWKLKVKSGAYKHHKAAVQRLYQCDKANY